MMVDYFLWLSYFLCQNVTKYTAAFRVENVDNNYMQWSKNYEVSKSKKWVSFVCEKGTFSQIQSNIDINEWYLTTMCKK